MNRILFATAFAFVLAPVLPLSGCATDIQVDPEGLRCDRGDICPQGYLCRGGICRSESYDPCAGVTCNAPPAPVCSAADVLTAYQGPGQCSPDSGLCVYPSQDTACADGCADGACRACGENACTLAPDPVCADANTLRTFAAPGTCDGAACSYPQMEVACANGCVDGACVNQDLCGGVTCTMPPPASCTDDVLTTYAAMGTCNPGTGQCTYAPMTQTCAVDCVQGIAGATCVGAPLSFEQVGPGVRSAVFAVDLAPGSSGNHVLAVGPDGYVGRWNGTSWTQLPSGTTKDLYAVWLRSATAGFIVGEDGTALRYDGATLTALTLPGANSDLVAVHGRGMRVLVAARDGTAWRSTDGVTFTQAAAPMPTLPHTYDIRDAYVAPDDAERLAGSCSTATGSFACVLYGAPGSTAPLLIDAPSGFGNNSLFTSAGPSVDTASAFVAQGTTVRRHTNSGTFSVTNTPNGLSGGPVVGIAGDTNAPGDAVFLLTSRTQNAAGQLYHFVQGNAASSLMLVHGPLQALSRNHSGGVVVSDSGAAAANIFRRGVNTDEALDLAGNWVGVDVVPNGRRVLANAYADFGVKEPGQTTYRWAESPIVTQYFRGVVAGTSWVLGFGEGGRVYRWTPTVPHEQLGGSGSQQLNDGCRNSDNEAFLVGAGGTILRFDGNALTAMTSPTTEQLNAVHCAGPGEAFAAGRNGVVLRLSGGAWTQLGSSLPGMPQLTSVWAGDGAVYVAGDNFFASTTLSGTGWTVLSGRGGLSNLVGRSGTEIYATAFRDVVRFDGSNWQTVFTAPENLIAGTATPNGVLFAGPAGVVVEGR